MQPSMVDLTIQQEGFSAFVYDDATGLPIKPGYTCVGHPTVGIGQALDVDGLTLEEARGIFDARIARAERALISYAWFRQCDPVRQDVLTNMCFNLGITGLLNFKRMIFALMRSDYATASSEMMDSVWSRQVPNRAKALSEIMLTGKVPGR